jgi:hypothetical protein
MEENISVFINPGYEQAEALFGQTDLRYWQDAIAEDVAKAQTDVDNTDEKNQFQVRTILILLQYIQLRMEQGDIEGYRALVNRRLNQEKEAINRQQLWNKDAIDSIEKKAGALVDILKTRLDQRDPEILAHEKEIEIQRDEAFAKAEQMILDGTTDMGKWATFAREEVQRIEAALGGNPPENYDLRGHYFPRVSRLSPDALMRVYNWGKDGTGEVVSLLDEIIEYETSNPARGEELKSRLAQINELATAGHIEESVLLRFQKGPVQGRCDLVTDMAEALSSVIDKGESADVLEKVKNKHDYYLVNEKEEIDIAFIHGYTDPEIYIYLCGGRLRTLELDLESQQQKLEFQNTLKRLGRSSISDDDIALLHTDISAKMHHIISVKSWLEGMRAQDPEAYKLYITDAAARVRGSNSIRDENRTLFSQPVLERIDLICSSVAPERVAEVIAKVQARLSGEKKKA